MPAEAQVAYKSSTISNESSLRDCMSRRDETRQIGCAERGSYPSSPESYAMSETPFSATDSGLKPQIQSRGNRFQYYSRKLAFWRKKPKTASDVHSALHSLAKCHERYRKEKVRAAAVMKEWSECLAPPPPGHPLDLMQHMMIDEKMSSFMASALDAVSPVNDLEPKLCDIHLALVQTFDTIRREEANIKMFLRKQNSAERRYFKALADDMSTKDTDLLNHERIRLSADVEHATDQFRATCRRDLPLRFAHLALHYEKLGLEAAQSARHLDALINPTNAGLRTSSIRRQFSFSSPSSVGFLPTSPVSVSPLQLHKYPSACASSPDLRSATTQRAYEPLTPESDTNEPGPGAKSPAEDVQRAEMPLDADDFVWG